MDQKVIKPMSMELEEAQAQIVGAINDCASRVPFYLLERIVTDAARQVSALARKEREIDKQEYEKQIAAEQAKEPEQANNE